MKKEEDLQTWLLMAELGRWRGLHVTCLTCNWTAWISTWGEQEWVEGQREVQGYIRVQVCLVKVAPGEMGVVEDGTVSRINSRIGLGLHVRLDLRTVRALCNLNT